MFVNTFIVSRCKATFFLIYGNCSLLDYSTFFFFYIIHSSNTISKAESQMFLFSCNLVFVSFYCFSLKKKDYV